MLSLISFGIEFQRCAPSHGRTGRKKLGGQKEICPTFRIVPDHFRKFFFRNKLISATSPPLPPPPSPKKFRSVYHFRGQKTINCKYCPSFNRILHDYLYLNNKLRAFWLFYFPLFARLMLNICPTFRLCNLFGGAAAPPCHPGPDGVRHT